MTCPDAWRRGILPLGLLLYKFVLEAIINDFGAELCAPKALLEAFDALDISGASVVGFKLRSSAKLRGGGPQELACSTTTSMFFNDEAALRAFFGASAPWLIVLCQFESFLLNCTVKIRFVCPQQLPGLSGGTTGEFCCPWSWDSCNRRSLKAVMLEMLRWTFIMKIWESLRENSISTCLMILVIFEQPPESRVEILQYSTVPACQYFEYGDSGLTEHENI